MKQLIPIVRMYSILIADTVRSTFIAPLPGDWDAIFTKAWLAS
ncbi:MAG: hypothetical protein ACP5VE_01715 [Chthonomonadales bacterium]